MIRLPTVERPIAIRDWLDGCILPPNIAQVAVSSLPSRSRIRQRLLTVEDNSDSSQSGKPSRASLSHTSMRSMHQSLEPDHQASQSILHT